MKRRSKKNTEQTDLNKLFKSVLSMVVAIFESARKKGPLTFSKARVKRTKGETGPVVEITNAELEIVFRFDLGSPQDRRALLAHAEHELLGLLHESKTTSAKRIAPAELEPYLSIMSELRKL